jgi:hypothetical protein
MEPSFALRAALGALALAAAAAAHGGEIYRAVRPDGSVLFSDRPIPGGVPVGRNDRGVYAPGDIDARKGFAEAADALAGARVVRDGEIVVPFHKGRPARLAPEYYDRVRAAETRLAAAHARLVASRDAALVAHR